MGSTSDFLRWCISHKCIPREAVNSTTSRTTSIAAEVPTTTATGLDVDGLEGTVVPAVNDKATNTYVAQGTAMVEYSVMIIIRANLRKA